MFSRKGKDEGFDYMKHQVLFVLSATLFLGLLFAAARWGLFD